MTIETFNRLSDQQKVELIFDANKITEKVDNDSNYQLFQINDFFVEARTSLEGRFKRSFATFSLKELPAEYVGEVLSIPIVILDEPEPNNLKKGGWARKKTVFLTGSSRAS